MADSLWGMLNRQSKASEVADVFGRYLDRPNDPKARGTVQDAAFFDEFNRVLPPDKYGYTPADFGFLQQNPQYRGLRMVLPQSGGSYRDAADADGARLNFPRIVPHGPPNRPDPNDPHKNQIPRYPRNRPADDFGLREEVYGEMIRRGYPVYGGTGDFGGEFGPGFNPIGFGAR